MWELPYPVLLLDFLKVSFMFEGGFHFDMRGNQ